MGCINSQPMLEHVTVKMGPIETSSSMQGDIRQLIQLLVTYLNQFLILRALTLNFILELLAYFTLNSFPGAISALSGLCFSFNVALSLPNAHVMTLGLQSRDLCILSLHLTEKPNRNLSQMSDIRYTFSPIIQIVLYLKQRSSFVAGMFHVEISIHNLIQFRLAVGVAPGSGVRRP